MTVFCRLGVCKSREGLHSRLTQVTHTLHGPGWFEMDVDVSSSSTAAGALRILKSCSKSLVMDLAFVLEGQTPDALPEKILGTVEWNHFDLDPDNSPVIKVCGEDN